MVEQGLASWAGEVGSALIVRGQAALLEDVTAIEDLENIRRLFEALERGETFMKLLEQTVRELKGEEVEDDVRASVNLGIDLKIDEAFIPDMNQRLMIYRQMASARHDEELDRTLRELERMEVLGKRRMGTCGRRRCRTASHWEAPGAEEDP